MSLFHKNFRLQKFATIFLALEIFCLQEDNRPQFFTQEYFFSEFVPIKSLFDGRHRAFQDPSCLKNTFTELLVTKYFLPEF